MSKQDFTREQFQAEAARRMDGFVYTQLAYSDLIEVWQCKHFAQSHYRFDISVSICGISIVGDMDGLLFNVGRNYGIRFLASDDDIGYIHGKLERQCCEEEIYDKALKEQLMSWICAKFTDREDAPEWFHEDFPKVEHWPEFIDYLGKNTDFYDESQLCESLASNGNKPEEVYRILDGERDTLGDPDFCELNITRPCHELIQRLYMVSHAAKEIMKVQAVGNLNLPEKL